MPKYHPSYTHHGFAFTEIKRTGNIALFEGVAPSGRKEFEVHILLLRMAHPMSADAGTEILCSPPTSEWGQNGFTYQTKEKATEKFQSLATRHDQNTDSAGCVAA